MTAPFNLPAPSRCQSVYVVFRTWHRPVFLVNSRLGRFSAASRSSNSKCNHPRRHPLSRSYGVNLPSSLTRVLSSALGFSPRLPVSVYGTVASCIRLEGFLGSLITTSWLARRLVSPLPLRVISSTDLPMLPSYWLRPTFPLVGWPSLLRHPIAQTHTRRYRNFNLFPIAYALRPRLRIRLTLSGLPFLRKP